MSPDNRVKFTIIGLGHIMEVIFPCLINAFGGPDLAQRANATTTDAADLERKRRHFGIPVRLGENLSALDELDPDIIFFAPPPKVAPGLIETDLKAHLGRRRTKGLPLPEIYALPPLPPGRRYLEVLGSDILAANLIPNNVLTIAGRPVTDEGYYVVAFASPWPEASKARLGRVMASQGAQVAVDPPLLVPMLGGTCTVFSLWAVVPALADVLAEAGWSVSHLAVGEYLRARAQALSGWRPAVSEPATPSAVQGPATALLDQVALAWREGVRAFYAEIGFPAGAAGTLVDRGLDSILHTTQAENREVLHHHAVGAATKGGVLEKAIACFHELTLPLLRRAASGLPQAPSAEWSATLRAQVTETAHLVARHGMKLAG